jgi:hypothetical protein
MKGKIYFFVNFFVIFMTNMHEIVQTITFDFKIVENIVFKSSVVDPDSIEMNCWIQISINPDPPGTLNWKKVNKTYG